MSVVAVAVILGVAVAFMVRNNSVKVGPALLCIVLGLVIGATPVGPAVNEFLTAIGTWLWEVIQSW